MTGSPVASFTCHAEGEAGGENDGARHQGHEGVQGADADSLAGKGVLLAHIAAEDLHGGDAQREGEEGLVHGVGNEAAQAVLADGIHRGQQVELHALRRAGKGQAMASQHQDQHQQSKHHHLGDPLQALLQTEAAHNETHHHYDLRKQRHGAGIAQHFTEDIGRRLRLHTGVEHAGEELAEVADHPAGDGGVVHHQQVAADQAEPTVDMPLGAGLFQGLVGQHGALASGAAHCQFHGQHGDAHGQQTDQIEQHKITAAVFTGDVRETPDVADADGAARAHQQEAQPGTEGFSFHGHTPHNTHTMPDVNRQ